MQYEFSCGWLVVACAALGCGGSSADRPTVSASGGSGGHVERATDGASTAGGSQGVVGSAKTFALADRGVTGYGGASSGSPDTGRVTVGGRSAWNSNSINSGGVESVGGVRGTGDAAGAAGESARGGASGITGSTSATSIGSSGAGASNLGGAATTGCDDRATLTAMLDGEDFWEATEIPTTSGSKSYLAFPNWWNRYSGQLVHLAGLGFTISGSTPASNTSSSPAGSPSLVIGGYSGHQSLGSNLPKLVSSIARIPTVMATNALSMETSHVAAMYQFVFTGTGAPLRVEDPRVPRYLEIWLYKPTSQQPAGELSHSARSVDGVTGSWDVWLTSRNPAYVVTYVSTSPLGEISFDANSFIRDAVKTSYVIESTIYLNAIFGGFHVWAGADGMQMKQFCVQVN